MTTIVGLSLLIALGSCRQTEQNGSRRTTQADTAAVSLSGVLIENYLYRGTEYTDSLGRNYKLRYIPISITNDTSVTVDIAVEFDQLYPYPGGKADETFQVIPLPSEWALDGQGISEKMWNDLKHYIARPTLNLSLEPSQHVRIAIGTFYPLPAQNGGIDAKALFIQNAPAMYEACVWLPNSRPQTGHTKTLALKLDFEGCMVIPCGEIRYRD